MTFRLDLVLAASLAAAAGLLVLQQLAHERDGARRAAAQAEGEARVARAERDLSNTAARAVGRAQARELNITIRSEEAAHEVAEAAGGEPRISDDVLRSWGDAIDRLRDDHLGAAADGAVDARTAGGAVPPA